MSVLDPNTLAAATAVTVATLADTATINMPTLVDNGLAKETTYALRDVSPCRATLLAHEHDVSDGLRQQNKQLYRVTMPPSAVVELNDQVIVSGECNVTGICVQDNSDQTDDLVAVIITIAVGV